MGNVAVTAGAELLARLLEAGLTERQAVVLLGTQAGWTAEEIHEALKVSRSTVESHLAAARKILKKNLSGD
jgi:DNA-directed RNA polymerase specialized sigma24 family protein